MRPGLTTLVTYRPDGTGPQFLSEIAHVSPAVYSFTCPGGCQDLTATVFQPPRWRTDALDPGRILKAHRGGTIVWAGVLDEPVPAEGGWQLSAHGTGSQGNDYRAVWTGGWTTSTPDQVVNNAIAAGLPWINPGIGSPAGMWIGQQVDSGSETVSDLLNMICNKGGLTWSVATAGGGNVLSVFALPTAVTHLLVAAGPVPRSVAAGATTLRIRYASAVDSGGNPAVYSLTSVTDTARETAQGHTEDYLDLSSAGTYTPSTAQAVGSQVLKRFTRAAFTDAITLRHGQLLNPGGVPIDPGNFYADGPVMVARMHLADLGYSGDIARGPVTFLVGEYDWDDAACVATVTPFESMRHRFSDLLSVAAEGHPPQRRKPTSHHKKGR